MSNRSRKVILWFGLAVLLAIVFAVVAIPVWLIQPFAAQTTRGLGISFLLKSWSPVVTAAASLAAAILAFFIWKRSRWIGRILLVIPLISIGFFTWFAFQNHFEWMFNPLHQANFARAADADFVANDDIVLAVNINGDAVAFPVRQMAYHHIAQDVVGGTPITATY
jgi:hypothetical protein